MKTNKSRKTHKVNNNRKTIIVQKNNKTKVLTTRKVKSRRAAIHKPNFIDAGVDKKFIHDQVTLDLYFPIQIELNDQMQISDKMYWGAVDRTYGQVFHTTLGDIAPIQGQAFKNCVEELKELQDIYEAWRPTQVIVKLTPTSKFDNFFVFNSPLYLKVSDRIVNGQEILRLRPYSISVGSKGSFTMVYPKPNEQIHPDNFNLQTWYSLTDQNEIVNRFETTLNNTHVNAIWTKPTSIMSEYMFQPQIKIPIWTVECKITIALRGERKVRFPEHENDINELEIALNNPIALVSQSDSTLLKAHNNKGGCDPSSAKNLDKIKKARKTRFYLNKEVDRIFSPENAFSDDEQ